MVISYANEQTSMHVIYAAISDVSPEGRLPAIKSALSVVPIPVKDGTSMERSMIFR